MVYVVLKSTLQNQTQAKANREQEPKGQETDPFIQGGAMDSGAPDQAGQLLRAPQGKYKHISDRDDPSRGCYTFKSVVKRTSTSKRNNWGFGRIVKKNPVKKVEELQKKWTEAGFRKSRATAHRGIEEFYYNSNFLYEDTPEPETTLKAWGETEMEYCSVVRSPLCIIFGNQRPRVW